MAVRITGAACTQFQPNMAATASAPVRQMPRIHFSPLKYRRAITPAASASSPRFINFSRQEKAGSSSKCSEEESIPRFGWKAMYCTSMTPARIQIPASIPFFILGFPSR